MTIPDDDKADGPVKVVDRRWWTTGDIAEAAAGGRPRKPSYVEELEQRLAEKDKEIQTYLSRYRESAAEFEQIRARLRRDLDRDIERARRAVLTDVLEVADNLDRAITAASAHGTDQHDSLLKGVTLVRDLLLAKLASYQVRPIAAEGQAFDPRLHDAVSLVPVSDPARDETVVSVVRTGYTVGDDVLRPAAVAVGRLATSATSATSATDAIGTTGTAETACAIDVPDAADPTGTTGASRPDPA